MTVNKKMGILPQVQKDFYVLRLKTVGGDLTPQQFKKIAELAEKYGKRHVHLTTRQGIELECIRKEDLQTVINALEEVGVKTGVSGPRIRVVVACPGNAICTRGLIETKEIAKELDKNYFRKEVPHKLKNAVTGCPNNCARARENDIGIVGGVEPVWDKDTCISCDACIKICPTQAISKKNNEYRIDKRKCINCGRCVSICPKSSWKVKKRGYFLYIGGNAGKLPTPYKLVYKDLEEDLNKIYTIIAAAISFFEKNAVTGERYGHTIKRLGWENVRPEILKGVH